MPVIVIDDARHAAPLASALQSGGVPCAEVTLRTPAGLEAIEAMSSLSGFTLGAGTVTDPGDVARVASAGATFVVSPGFDDDVVTLSLESGLVPIPGIATGTEVQRAVRAGLTAVKLFPADRLGGLETLAALSAPFPQVQFMPSGGVGLDNASAYLAHHAVIAISGSWIAPRDLIAAQEFAQIEQRCRDVIALVERASR